MKVASFCARRAVVSCILLLIIATSASLANWPTYQSDFERSGSTTATAPTQPELQWVYKAPARPVAAWDEPAMWDGWSKVHDLKNRQVFDKAFHVASADGRIYFGSSVDDQVYCLDADTGRVLWTHFTEGPVRLAPSIANGHLYVGSDDGFVYCLDATSGSLLWKQSPGANTRRLAGNGRVISPWAIRTGIVVQDGTLFCGAGVIPSEGVFVLAMDAETGEQKWRTEMKDLPAQGYMLASPTRLYVLTSRDTPLVLDIKTGKRLHKVKGGTGGTYALLSGDTLLFGPGKTGDVSMIGESQDVLATFQGNHMIVAQPFSYLQSGEELSSLDRATYVETYARRVAVGRERTKASKQLEEARKEQDEQQIQSLEQQVSDLTESYKDLGNELKACLKWRAKCACPYALILAGGTLVAGGDGEVTAVDATNGRIAWNRKVEGKAYGLAVDDGKLWVSTDEGHIYCFADTSPPTRPQEFTAADASRTQRRVKLQAYAGPPSARERSPREIHGPFAEFVGPNSVRIEWDSDVPTTTEASFGVEQEHAQSFSDPAFKTHHEVTFDGVQRNVVYQFQVAGETEEGRRIATEAYRFDAHLYYLPMRPRHDHAFADAFGPKRELRTLANQMVAAAKTQRGYALIFGAVTGELAAEIALASEMRVIVIEPNPEKAKRVRNHLAKAGMYGSRVAVHQQDPSQVEYGPFLANLITSESLLLGSDAAPPDMDRVYASLRPAGGVFAIAGPRIQEWIASSGGEWNELDSAGQKYWLHRRDRLPNTGEWTHQYASADNSACSKDEQIRGDVTVQWWGRPGARPMPDRGNRNPAPVSANGRLYVQGNRTLFGLDAYNGAVLWAKQIPTMRRANIPRDGSNMVADDEHVFVAIDGKCVAFDGSSGERLRDFTIPESAIHPGHEANWGYVARVNNSLFGTSVRRGAQYLGDKGEWYQRFDEEDIARVTSDSLFSINASSGALQWAYDRGVLMNSTITIGNGLVYFIETRNVAAKESTTGRLFDEVLTDQVLVALDATTGEPVWEKPYDFSKCKYVTYITLGSNTLLITGTDEKSVFHTYAFDATTGAELWQHTAPDKKGHHTGQLAHPTIVQDLVYFNKHTYELRTGKVLGVHDFNWHGCGVMSASNHTVFSRYEYHGMLDLKTKQRTELLGIRSGCWLSLIPSGGLLLAPETSAGCSCGHSIQTSIAYVPKQLQRNASNRQPTRDTSVRPGG